VTSSVTAIRTNESPRAPAHIQEPSHVEEESDVEEGSDVEEESNGRSHLEENEQATLCEQ